MFDREERGREPSHKPALDLGCGAGMQAVELARRGPQVRGVEIVAKALGAARERARYPRDARCRGPASGFIGVILAEFRRAVAAEQCYEHLKRASAAALARDGMVRADLPRRIFEESYSFSMDPRCGAPGRIANSWGDVQPHLQQHGTRPGGTKLAAVTQRAAAGCRARSTT
jgi:SAM-dependent methyltransferase